MSSNNRRLAVVIAVAMSICLAGCIGFAPRYDEVLDEKTTSAYEKISTFLAEVELGKYEKSESFAEASDDYAKIQGLLAVAALRAVTLPVPTRGTAARGKAMLVSMIQGCKASIATLGALHKSGGLKPNTGTPAGAQVKCDQAAKAARAMKGS